MGSMIDKLEKVPEKQKVPGISYAYTDNGYELAVLDITHPAFLTSIDEKDLPRLQKLAQKRDLGHMPRFLRNYYAKRSFILGGLLLKGPETRYLNGLSTLMIKLGPNLIGGGKERDFDRNTTRTLGSVLMRMRVRDMAQLQAKDLLPKLRASPGTDLTFINIAGGAGTDSLNALILINKEDPQILKGRPIRVLILDIDDFGPNFAKRSVEVLKGAGGALQGLDIELEHILYDWSRTVALANLLKERASGIMLVSSEGGLFEYGTDQDIINNLRALHENTPPDFLVVGDVLLDEASVDPSFRSMAKVSGLSVNYLGKAKLSELLNRTGWRLEAFFENNFNYNVFSIKKL